MFGATDAAREIDAGHYYELMHRLAHAEGTIHGLELGIKTLASLRELDAKEMVTMRADAGRLGFLAGLIDEAELYRMLYPHYVIGACMPQLRAAIDAAMAVDTGASVTHEESGATP